MEESDITLMQDQDWDKCEEIYSGFIEDKLQTTAQALIFHIFIGHGVVKAGQQAMLVN